MNSTLKYIIGLLGIALLFYCLWYFRTIVTYILISAALSIAGQPVMRMLGRLKFKKFSLSNGIKAFITLISLWFFFILFFSLIIPVIIKEANILSSIDVYSLYHRLEQPLNDIFLFLKKYGLFENSGSFESYLTAKMTTIFSAGRVSNIISGLTGIFGNLLVAFFSISFISFFFLKESSLFTSGVLLLVPDKRTEEVQRILKAIEHLLSRYIIGIALEVVMVMILVTFGLWLSGLEFQHAIVCGVLSGIFNIIPYVGPWLGAGFGIIIGVATNTHLQFQTELLPLIGFMLLVYASVQLIDNILFQPLIYSSSVNAHPLEIFLVILAAGYIAGILGMILAIPAYTVLRVVAKEFFSNFKIVQKITENI